MCVNWKSLQSMTPENFPNLKYLDVPINAIYDYVVSDDIPVNYFPGLHIKYSHWIDHSGLYNYKLADRYYHLYQGFKIFESSSKWLSIKFRINNDWMRQIGILIPSSWLLILIL